MAVRSTIDGATLVATGGGPLGGDVIEVDIVLGTGAELRLGSSAAQVALPNENSAISQSTYRIECQSASEFAWCPEPLIVAGGAHHHATVWLDVAADARVRWHEHVVLGRSDEIRGRFTSTWNVVRAGSALLRQEFTVGGAHDASLDQRDGAYRVFVSTLGIGIPRSPDPVDVEGEWAYFDLAPDAWLFTAFLPHNVALDAYHR